MRTPTTTGRTTGTFKEQWELVWRPELAIDLVEASLFGTTVESATSAFVAQKAADLIAAAIMVSGGFGTALVPESILNLRLPNVIYRPLVTEIDCMIDLHFAYRKDEESPLLDELLECVHAFARKTEHAETAADIGEQAPVNTHGILLVEAGAAIAAGAEVESDANGKAITKAAGISNGFALDAAAAAGDVIRIVRGI